MFNYTHECVINDPSTITVATNPDSSKTLIIPRIANIKDGAIKSATKFAAVAAVKGGFSIDASKLTGATAPGYYRLIFKLACSEKYAEWALANWHAFEKPYMVELKAGATKNDVADALKLVLDADIATIAVSASGSTVTVTFVDEAFSLAYEDASNYAAHAYKVSDGCDDCTGYAVENEVELADVFTSITDSAAGMGTYKYVLHNLRFPTYENLRYASPNEEEMPEKNAYYTQYRIVLNVEREMLGGLSAAGQKVTSESEIILFVKQTNASTVDTVVSTALAQLKDVDGSNVSVSLETVPEVEAA